MLSCESILSCLKMNILIFIGGVKIAFGFQTSHFVVENRTQGLLENLRVSKQAHAGWRHSVIEADEGAAGFCLCQIVNVIKLRFLRPHQR